MKYIQEKVIECKKCNKPTRHFRNASKPNYLLHLILIIITAGIWIIPFLFILVGGIQIGGESFVCTNCGEKYQSTIEKYFNIFLLILFGVFLFLILVGILSGGK